jgi:hypothetical protein
MECELGWCLGLWRGLHFCSIFFCSLRGPRSVHSTIRHVSRHYAVFFFVLGRLQSIELPCASLGATNKSHHQPSRQYAPVPVFHRNRLRRARQMQLTWLSTSLDCIIICNAEAGALTIIPRCRYSFARPCMRAGTQTQARRCTRCDLHVRMVHVRCLAKRKQE